MATWVTHFRIAEQFIKQNLPLPKIDFLVGNIGPDCGLIGADGKPTPPKRITHFVIDGKMSSETFYNQYLHNITDYTTSKASYLLGYYFHLVTVEEWIKLTNKKKKEKVIEDILDSPDYTRLVKQDWYGYDFCILSIIKTVFFGLIFSISIIM